MTDPDALRLIINPFNRGEVGLEKHLKFIKHLFRVRFVVQAQRNKGLRRDNYVHLLLLLK